MNIVTKIAMVSTPLTTDSMARRVVHIVIVMGDRPVSRFKT